jgi:transposase
MSKPNDLSRSLLPFDQLRTLVAVIEMSQSSWLVSGMALVHGYTECSRKSGT